MSALVLAALEQQAPADSLEVLPATIGLLVAFCAGAVSGWAWHKRYMRPLVDDARDLVAVAKVIDDGTATDADREHFTTQRHRVDFALIMRAPMPYTPRHARRRWEGE